MKISFTKKEVIKFVISVYIPCFAISYFIRIFTKEQVNYLGHLVTALGFSYPVYLIVNLKMKKLIKWFVIGVIPIILYFLLIYKLEISFKNLLGLFLLSIVLANIIYPLGLLGINTFKDYWEMSKEMTWGRKIGLLLSLIFILISILKRARW
jgi:magnesium-transporting ATPase (P-type)